jgi:chromate transporter
MRARPGSPAEVFLAFLRLGCTAFGGPVAHLGYFRAEFVERRRWLDEAAYADLVGLCQFLPGPASSQSGFALGLMRAGAVGGCAAWAGFTLPSALLMVAFASGSAWLAALPAGAGLLHGLRLVAVAVVAQAVLGMARQLCPDRARATVAVVAAAAALLAPVPAGQVGGIALGAVAGLVLLRGRALAGTGEGGRYVGVTRRAGAACLGAFAGLLALSAAGGRGPSAALFAAFYRSGALVFGGGHVVLPLLRDAVVVPGWVGEGAFLAGYGAAQALPGPLFTVAAYLGAVARPAPYGSVAGAVIALAGIFLPGLLLVAGALPFWDALRGRAGAQAALRGANAAVVGVLGAALYSPLWTSSVVEAPDAVAALTGFVLLVAWRTPPWLVAALGAGAGATGALGA